MKQAVLGLIGAGYLANAQHLPNLMFTPHARLKTVCDLNGEAARAAAEKFHIPCVETDARKVFADPEIDGVVIVTREDQHAPLAIAALEAGKHVYVEKPLADTRENCRKVVDAETRTGKRVAVGFNRRYVTMFGLQELRGSDPTSSWTTEDRELVIMPIRIPEDK